MKLKKLAISAMLVAVAVVLSSFSIPIGPSRCFPIQHLCNVLAAVFLGPVYGVSMAFCTALIRNLLGTGSLLAFPGSMVGAFVSAMIFKYTRSKIGAYLGEVIGTGILGGMLTVVADYGVNLEGKRNQLLISLQDHLENVMWPRLERESGSERSSAAAEAEERRENGNVRTIGRERDRRLSGARRGAEQTAASRENAREAANRDKKEDRSAKDWLDDLNPEQKRMLGEMLKEFL